MMWEWSDLSPRDLTVNVNHHRSPTDESIKLYNEMVEKARSQVVKELCGSATIDSLVARFCTFRSPHTFEYEIYIVVKNETYKINIDLSSEQDEIRQLIFKKLTEIITSHLLIKFFDGSNFKHF